MRIRVDDFTTFFQISTSVLQIPIAVTSMRRATILWDPMHARANQDTQEMEEHALVSLFKLFLTVIWKKGNNVFDS